MATVVVRGAGDVGSAIAHRLYLAGHAVVLHDRPRPAHARRKMAFTDALFAGWAELEGVYAKRADGFDKVRRMLRCRRAVIVSDQSFESLVHCVHPDILVDARMRKRDFPEKQQGFAPLVIGLGPNFQVGKNVDVAVETAYGPNLGAVVLDGATAPLAGEPRELGGHGRERFVYSASGGIMHTAFEIGDYVEAGAIIGSVGEVELRAPLSGWLRGLTRDGAIAEPGCKVVEVQTVDDASVGGIGERPRQIADGVLRAVSQSKQPPSRLEEIEALGVGTGIATLGGLIGLGGAEFRLPVLIGLFRIGTRDAILTNVIVSLVTVAAALLFRIIDQGALTVLAFWPQALNLLVGTLAGAWFSARLASSLALSSLHRIIAALLVGLAIVIALHVWISPFVASIQEVSLARVLVGLPVGLGIGAVSSLLGVAGGELLIPALVLLYGLDVRLAGTVSLAISLPTLTVTLWRLRRLHSLGERWRVRNLAIWMSAGSLTGSLLGAKLAGIVDSRALSLALAAILAISAVRLARMH